jgi:hypothetical protein
VATYNDVLSEGGEFWPQVRAVAETVNLLTHLRALVGGGTSRGYRRVLYSASAVARG